ncbi:MAG: DUF927 domain-containing protein [Gammaproteobacteria bacterium]|nr:DUF927 domain-containing protein [Gammaproteobacteria bacterium]NIR85204.1 DUF927 domain-containing protein [Gammaproteobacteria bacterium]NIU06254.1 DUF927 domain-containing protein [Gammaproteobacteria bacterium]NIX87527.1 DUF927 domain-containing protein [Gammaproteobacteria bacterium]
MSKPKLAELPPGAMRVREVPKERILLKDHREHLQQTSGLTDETIKLVGIYTEIEPRELAQLLNWKSWPRSVMGSGMVFPYRVPGAAEASFCRVRPSKPKTVERSGKKIVRKYEQPRNVSAMPFFPPRSVSSGALQDVQQPLYFTEGEKKAALLDQLGYATVGFPGVFNYHDVDKFNTKTKEGLELHPLLREHVAYAGRSCVIVYDADAAVNDQVQLAARRLAGLLLAAGARSVELALPPEPDKKQGIDDYYVAQGEAATRELLERGRTSIEALKPESPLPQVRSIRSLREAPVPEGLRVPPGYEIGERDPELWAEAEDEDRAPRRISGSPILIKRLLVDLYTGEERVEVVFLRNGRWVTACVDRRAIADSRTMISDLIPLGAPVTSNNASKLVDWFEALERVNSSRLERIACVGRAGWHQIDERWTFVLSEPVDGETTLTLDTRGDRRKMFGALSRRGGYDAHLEALRRTWQSDLTAAVMIAGALSAPLLKWLEAPNFAIHLPGDSSRGKTSMLKIAASVYGDPGNDQWVGNWNTTSVAAELRAAVLTDLPLCFDEVGAGDMRQTERLVYMLINGGGKARGHKDLQLRETASWRTVLLSTGEHELADESANTGAQIRVLQFHVGGFGELGADGVDALREAACANHGHVGRRWVEELLALEDWKPYLEAYKDFARILRRKAQSPLQQRTALYFAVLCMAESMAAELFDLGERGGLAMQRAFRDAEGKRDDVRPVAERALEAVEDWVSSEPRAFPRLEPSAVGDDEPKGGQAQVLHGYQRDDAVLFIPRQLQRFCAESNLSYREVLRGWAERQWLGMADPGRHTKTMRIAGRVQRLVVLSRPSEEDFGVSA